MEMNRRNLLKGSVAMGAAGLVASKAAVAAVPAKWDETVDIVVSALASLDWLLLLRLRRLDQTSSCSRRCRLPAETRSSMAAF